MKDTDEKMKMGQGFNSKSVARLAVTTYVVRFLIVGSSFVSNVLLSRLLGPEGKGTIATFLFWASLAASLVVFGLDSATIYFVGKSAGRFRRLTSPLLIYATLVSLTAALVLIQIDRSASIFKDTFIPPWIILGLTLSAAVTILFNALYIGLEELAFTNKVAAVGAALYLLFLLASLVVQPVDVHFVLLGITVIQFSSAGFLVAAALRRRSTRSAELFRWSDLLKYALKVYVGNLGGLLYYRLNFMILSISATMSEVGVYSIALVIGDLILILPTALINIIFPKVAQMSREQAIRRVSSVARVATAVAFLLALALATAATVVIPLVFGPAFQSGVGMVWILCLGAWAATNGMVLSIYFNSINKPEIPSSATWIGCILVGVLTLTFMPWGGYGAAIALSLSRVLVSSYMLIMYLRDSHENLSALFPTRLDDWQQGFGLLRSVWL